MIADNSSFATHSSSLILKLSNALFVLTLTFYTVVIIVIIIIIIIIIMFVY